MSDQTKTNNGAKSTTTTKTNDAKPLKTWGVTSAAYLYTLRDRPVQVITTDGKAYRGALVGVDIYDVVLKQPNGFLILIAKHAVKLIAADV